MTGDANRPAGLGDHPGQMPPASLDANEERYLTVREVAKLARCEHKTVRRAIASARLPAFRVAGRLLVRETDARAWIEASPAIASSKPVVRSRLSSTMRRASRGAVPGSVADLRAIEREANSR